MKAIGRLGKEIDFSKKELVELEVDAAGEYCYDGASTAECQDRKIAALASIVGAMAEFLTDEQMKEVMSNFATYKPAQ